MIKINPNHSSRVQSRSRMQADRMSTMSTGGVVVSVDPRSDTMKWGSAKGRMQSPIAHPYVGPSSWIRVCPERSTKLVASYRGEDYRPYIAAYQADDLPGADAAALIEATLQGTFYYRYLSEGEIQLVSSGLAEVSALQTGNLELRGGGVCIKLRNDNLEIEARSPVHRAMTLGSAQHTIGNESRFGVVTRPSPLDPATPVSIKHNGEFAKEHMVHLTLEGMTVPAVSTQSGVVVEPNGTVAEMNGVPLRARYRFGTVNNTVVGLYVDELGQVVFDVPQSDSGVYVRVQQSDMKLDVGKNLTFNVAESISTQSDKVDMQASQIVLAGNLSLVTQTFQSTLSAAASLPVAAPTLSSLAASVNAIITYLQTLSPGLEASLTRKVTAS